MGAMPRAVICCRCASIHRRSSSVLMPAAWAIWSLLFAFIVGEGLTLQRYDFFPTKQYIYKYIYCGEKTQRNPRIPTYPHETLLIPHYPHENRRKAYGGGARCRTFALRLGFERQKSANGCLCRTINTLKGPWSLVLISLRSPLGVPYGAARNGGVGSGECGW